MPSQKQPRLRALLAVSGVAAYSFPDCVNGPLKSNLVCNASANYLDRAKAVASQFPLSDLLSNTQNGAPGVQTLGLPAYQWWSEALVGICACNMHIK